MTDHRYTVIFDVRLECLQASEDGKFHAYRAPRTATRFAR